MYRFLSYGYQILVVVTSLGNVYMEEPCNPPKYMEERLLEKMMEVDLRMQKILERINDAEQKDQPKTTEVKSSYSVLKIKDLEANGWQMIFRATSGNGQNTFKAWMNDQGTNQDKPMTFERSRGLHFRDRIVSSWPNLGIKLVKLGFYDHDREVAHVIFNGRGSDINNWFDKKRVISSSYSDVTSTDEFNLFSIAGDFRPGMLERRFIINRHYGGCDNDYGHLAVIDTNTESACAWDQHPVYPQFIYSKINSFDYWNRRQFGRADFMAIFIKSD